MTRPDIEALREQARILMERGPKNPRPVGAVRDAVGQAIGSAKRIIEPDREDIAADEADEPWPSTAACDAVCEVNNGRACHDEVV